MITHSIKVHEAPVIVPLSQIPNRPRFVAGSSPHRDYIRNTTVSRAKMMFSEGQYVQLKHGEFVGEVLAVHNTEADGVEWSNMKCRPVEVWWWERQESVKYHPDELVAWSQPEA